MAGPGPGCRLTTYVSRVPFLQQLANISPEETSPAAVVFLFRRRPPLDLEMASCPAQHRTQTHTRALLSRRHQRVWNEPTSTHGGIGEGSKGTESEIPK